MTRFRDDTEGKAVTLDSLKTVELSFGLKLTAGSGKLVEAVVSLGGAISGEHGIGLAKSPFLRVQHGPAEIKAMRAVKRALDPNGILNPGKMFDVVRVWEFPRVQVHLPWDHK